MNAVSQEILSMEQMIYLAFNLSMRIVYKEVDDRGYFIGDRQSEIPEPCLDMVFGHADGLTQKYYLKMVSCRCSLNQMINFDLGKFEAGLADDIFIMRLILDKIGECKNAKLV